MTAVFSFRCVKLPIMALKISILISLMPKCILWGPIDTSLGLCPMWDIRPKIIKLKSRDILFVYNIRFNNPIVLKFCTEHGSYTVVLCTKFQDDWIIETDVMDKRDFARSEFKMIFGRMYYIAHNPSYTLWFNSDLVYRAGEKLKPQPNITAVRDAWQQHTLSLVNSVLTHWGRDKIDAISQTTFSSAFCWMKMLEFRIEFHWSLFLRVQLTIFYDWFR